MTNKNYVLVKNDNGFYYQSTAYKDGFTVSVEDVIKDRKKIAHIVLDKRAMITAISKLSIVTTGVADPKITLSTKKSKELLQLEVKSLSNKKSIDKISVGEIDAKEDVSIKLRQENLDNTLSILDNTINLEIYKELVIFSDEQQKILFSTIQD